MTERYTRQRQAFGEQIRTLRKRRGLTQAGLAKLLGIHSLSSVTAYERGRQWPEIPVLIKISEVLDADLHELLTGTTYYATASELVKLRGFKGDVESAYGALWRVFRRFRAMADKPKAAPIGFCSVAQTARLLCLTERQIRRLCTQGKLEGAIRRQGKWFILAGPEKGELE